MKRAIRVIAAAAMALSGTAFAQPSPDGRSVAVRFGALERVKDISLSPDGKRIAYISQSKGARTAVYVADVAEGGPPPKMVASADGKPGRLTDCGWASNDHLICGQYGIVGNREESMATFLSVIRRFVVDTTGAKPAAPLAQRAGAFSALRGSQYDGEVIDWSGGSDGHVLVTQDFVPERETGSRLRQSKNGLGVVRVDTRTLNTTRVEDGTRDAVDYIADAQGNVRLMALNLPTPGGYNSATTQWLYRKAGSREWLPFVKEVDFTPDYVRPIAVDATSNSAYVARRVKGRLQLNRILLDGSLREETVLANAKVDVDAIVRISPAGRVIGASFATERREQVYFDPEFKSLAASLSRSLPGSPAIDFVGASSDEKRLLVNATSDTNPGQIYLLDRTAKSMRPLLLVRPELENVELAAVRPVTYASQDGVQVPAYLTMPPKSVGKPIGAIVLPHGGPSARDELQFDWLPQFFAQRGYAVLQPNFRGSAGYGDEWFVDNGFKSWKLAIADVIAGGRFMQNEIGSDRVGIFGWSYGGYAALQAATVEPALFKAVVAVAPVTDLPALKAAARVYTSGRLVEDFIGSGPHVTEGSPARRAAMFTAPVLLFHGDLDINVRVNQSRMMDKALREAGKSSEFVTFTGLDHQLADSDARAALLEKSDGFLRKAFAP